MVFKYLSVIVHHWCKNRFKNVTFLQKRFCKFGSFLDCQISFWVKATQMVPASEQPLNKETISARWQQWSRLKFSFVKSLLIIIFVSSQGALHYFFIKKKSVVLQLLERPDWGHTTEGLKEKKMAQHLAGIKPMTSRLWRRVLYHCDTTAAHLGWKDRLCERIHTFYPGPALPPRPE